MTAKERIGQVEVQLEELAKRIAQDSKPYASHFRQLVHVLPEGVGDLYTWLADLSDGEIQTLAQKLEALEGKARPHFTAALKRARHLAAKEVRSQKMPASFPEALRWAMVQAGVSFSRLAGEVGVSWTTLWVWARGVYLPRSQQQVHALEEALGLERGTLVARVPRWGQQHTGAKDLFSKAFLRLAPLARYGKPWSDISPSERESLERELRERLGTQSLRHRRARIAMASSPYALPYEKWPSSLQGEWQRYRTLASPQRGTPQAVLVQRSQGSPTRRPVREETLKKERGALEKFFGFLVREKRIPFQKLHLGLLGDLRLVDEYLQWRWSRFPEEAKPVTGTDEAFLGLVGKLARRGLVKLDEEELKSLKASIRASKDTTEGYFSVKPLLEDPDPLRWIEGAIRLMLEDLRGRVGDLMTPRLEGMSKKALTEALALYRDAVIFWAMSRHPLRAKHWYAAKVDLPNLTAKAQKGNVYLEGGVYHLLYRKGEFKNAHSKVFQHQGEDDPILFPLDSKEVPDAYRLEVGGQAVALNDLFRVYLERIRPSLLEGLGRGKDDEALFPGLDNDKKLYHIFQRRSAYVIALPGAPMGLRPFGPHSMRHIVATSVVKQTGSLEHAANLLLDSIEMVHRHYARFLPVDRYGKSWGFFHAQRRFR